MCRVTVSTVSFSCFFLTLIIIVSSIKQAVALDGQMGPFFSTGQAQITVIVPPLLVKQPQKSNALMSCVRSNSDEMLFDVGLSRFSATDPTASETVFVLKNLTPGKLDAQRCASSASYSNILNNISSRFRNSGELAKIVGKDKVFSLVLVPAL